jgi:uncharacterized protein
VTNDRTARCAIGVMTKAPQPGRSKTRLCPPLLPDQAATLSAAFLRDTAGNIEAAARSAPVASYAAYAPQGAETLLRAHLPDATELLLADGSPPMPDGVEGLGRSLLHAIRGMLMRGHEAACVLSADSPTLPTQLLVEAANHLLAPGDRAVLGATEDGGYYLLGLKQAHAAFFTDIPWSTDSVAAVTRARAQQAGVKLVELDRWYDVDDAASLALLLADRTGYLAPHTRAAIDRLGLRETLSGATA